MRTILFVALLSSLPALAGEKTFVFHSEEDVTTPADPAVCAQAPFHANVLLGASLWSVKTRGSDGKVVKERRTRIGRATACLQLTSLLFPAGLAQRFYVRFDLPQGSYLAEGTCTISSNDVPVPFLVLAGCTLKLDSAPQGSLGGMATSSSIFNPLKRPGYSTGSLWTLHEYTLDDPHHDDDQAVDGHDD